MTKQKSGPGSLLLFDCFHLLECFLQVLLQLSLAFSVLAELGLSVDLAAS